MKKLKRLFALLGIALIIAASGAIGKFAGSPEASNQVAPVQAATATTYTQTLNADKFFVNAPDAYEPGSTYDTIGLDNPQEMYVDTIEENGQKVDYAYILNAPNNGMPFILKMNLSADNPASSVEKIDLSFLYANKASDENASPTGLWIQTINGQKYIYVADARITKKVDTYNSKHEKAVYTYTGFIYMIEMTKEGELGRFKVITEPVSWESVNKNQISRAPGFDKDNQFDPQKISVDAEGKIYVASPSTGAGMILLSNSYLNYEDYKGRWGLNQLIPSDFISFFTVNSIQYSFLYYLVKTFGNEKQLAQIDIPEPIGFTNVYIDHQNLVYSMTTKANGSGVTTYPSMTKHKTDGSAIFTVNTSFPSEYTDMTVTREGITFLSEQNGMIVVIGPSGEFIYMFGSDEKNKPNIVGFFSNLVAIGVDTQRKIWALDSSKNLLQSFNPTEYSNAIFDAMIAFENHEYERSEEAWLEVLKYDELSVFANDGIGKAYYYNLEFKQAAKYFSISKNRSLYSEAFWEIRNSWLQSNLSIAFVILLAVIVVLLVFHYLFKFVPKLATVKGKTTQKIRNNRFFKDITVGFRLIRHPVDTFYELKTKRRGSVLGATIHYILGLVIFTWYMYGKALPFQHFSENTLNASIVIFGFIAVLAIFVICNYLVSAIKDGEGTFMNIYKFTGYSLLPIIICLPCAVGLSYVLTLTEQIVMDLLFQLALWGSIFFLIIGILETHNYTFKQTFWNVVLTIIFMVLFVIVCLTVLLMFDQVSTLVENIVREVKLRAGWY